MIAELQSSIDQTLMRADAQKEKHKRNYVSFCKRNIRLEKEKSERK